MNGRHAVFYSKKILTDRKGLSFYHQLLHEERKSRDEIEAINWERRKKIVKFACEHVPFYREKYREYGFESGDLKQREDFEKLPLLTRQDIQRCNESLMADNADKRYMRMSTTGGSTGSPVKVWHDTRFLSSAVSWQILHWWGISPYENQAVIWRSGAAAALNESLKFRLKQWPVRRIYLDASTMDESNTALFIEKMNKVRPSLVTGYVGGIEYVADYILRNKIQIDSPRAVWTTASPVAPPQRKKIEQAFRCKVLDQYGCCEIYWLAAQCPSCADLHVHYTLRHLEFVDEKGDCISNTGDEGAVVATDLYNYVFPLIRYSNGDRGRWAKTACVCGCNLPLIKSVCGRISERVVTPGGLYLSGEYLTTLFDDFPYAVRQFQIQQFKDYSLILRVVRNSEYSGSDAEISTVLSALKEKCRHEMPIQIEYVNEIPHDRGKTRYIISDI
jgi:phenylacetate-CoA ligase